MHHVRRPFLPPFPSQHTLPRAFSTCTPLFLRPQQRVIHHPSTTHTPLPLPHPINLHLRLHTDAAQRSAVQSPSIPPIPLGSFLLPITVAVNP